MGVKHLFFGYNFGTGEVPRLLSSRVAKRQRSGSKEMVSVPSHDVVWLPGLAYSSMESGRADWHPANDEVADVPVGRKAPCPVC